jgi:hypothetical protein
MKCFEMNKNKKIFYQNLWGTMKKSSEKNLGLQIPHFKRRAQISNLTFHLKELEKERETKPKAGKRK